MRTAWILLAATALAIAAAPAPAQERTAPVSRLEREAASWDDARLTAEADACRDAARTAASDIASLEAKLKDAPPEAAKGIEEALASGKAARTENLDRLQILVGAMKPRGLDVTPYQVFLLNARGLDSENLSAGAAVGLAAYWLERGKKWAMDHGPALILKLIAFLFILLVFRILSRLLGRVVAKALSISRVRAPALLENFFINVTTKTTFLVGLLIALSVVGVPLGPVLAGIGVLGFVVGFALQDTLANFAAGIMVLLYRPFDVGDYVTAGGVSGTVSAMSLVSTTLLTPDNQKEIVPNGKIWGDRITNVTANPTRRLDLTFGIGYDDDADRAEKLLTQIVTSHPLVLETPEPLIRLHNLGDSSVDFVVRPWVKTTDYWTVYWDLTKSVKQGFDREGISIPYPQRDIHLVSGPQALAATT